MAYKIDLKPNSRQTQQMGVYYIVLKRDNSIGGKGGTVPMDVLHI